jgi:hypothetical protein
MRSRQAQRDRVECELCDGYDENQQAVPHVEEH